jgi:exopolyphosphatase/guanosine-5'-triphosphate,3'-diphosphate pyrophosphatase
MRRGGGATLVRVAEPAELTVVWPASPTLGANVIDLAGLTEEQGSPGDAPVAVIDIGSNSGRVVVVRPTFGDHLEFLADGRASLRLARDIEQGDQLGSESIERTLAAVRDFTAIATGAGARRILAVATSAVREATNGQELLDLIEAETGLRAAIISGEEEARFSFIGAVAGLHAESGVLLDVGGGSVEMSSFADREMTGGSTLPLGALRLSVAFFPEDRSTSDEVRALREHTARLFEETGVTAFSGSERLVGTGGTIRNLARIDRESGTYPIPRLHGYVLTRRRLESIVERLASLTPARRRSVPGLNSDRADSIVAGGLVVLTAMELLAAHDILVSGQGLREGVALDALRIPLQPVEEVRSASVTALAVRFRDWDPARAGRRVAVAQAIQEAVDPTPRPSLRERVIHAATLLDIGRSIDFYERYRHAADIVTAADLAGFSHRKVALLASVLRQGDEERMPRARYRPLVSTEDQPGIRRCGALLALADEVEHRLPPGHQGQVRCEAAGKRVRLAAPIADPWRRSALAARFERAFARRLEFVD